MQLTSRSDAQVRLGEQLRRIAEALGVPVKSLFDTPEAAARAKILYGTRSEREGEPPGH